MREVRIRSRAPFVQRCATGSPARWTMASTPATAVGGGGPARSETPVTSSPRVFRAVERRDPMRPVAPVIATRIGQTVEGRMRCSSIAAKPIVLWSVVAIPLLRASSDTASATAGATSRLNTEGMM